MVREDFSEERMLKAKNREWDFDERESPLPEDLIDFIGAICPNTHCGNPKSVGVFRTMQVLQALHRQQVYLSAEDTFFKCRENYLRYCEVTGVQPSGDQLKTWLQSKLKPYLNDEGDSGQRSLH